MAFAEPVVLTGDLVLLEPLRVEHHDALVAAAEDGQLWTLSYTGVPRPEEMRTQIEAYLVAQQTGELVPFTVRDRSTGRVIGQTTFCNVDAGNRRLEIGGTWYAQSSQRTGVNTEAKLLLLSHAFDRLDTIAVELRTHWLNHRSRRAIERLGAKQDGVLRSHKIMPDGTLRDTVVFSILAHEWSAVRNELNRSLAAHDVPPRPGRHARPSEADITDHGSAADAVATEVHSGSHRSPNGVAPSGGWSREAAPVLRFRAV